MPIVAGQPNRIELNNGSYMLFDFQRDQFRVAVYERKVSKSTSLEAAVSRALGLPLYNKRVKEIVKYIRGTEKFEGMTLE